MVLACNNSKLARKQSEATKMTRVEGKRVFILGSECVTFKAFYRKGKYLEDGKRVNIHDRLAE